MRKELLGFLCCLFLFSGCGKEKEKEGKNTLDINKAMKRKLEEINSPGISRAKEETVKLPDGRTVTRKSASGEMTDAERQKIREKLTRTAIGRLDIIKEGLDPAAHPLGKVVLRTSGDSMFILSVPSYSAMERYLKKKVKVTGILMNRKFSYQGKEYSRLFVESLDDVEIIE